MTGRTSSTASDSIRAMARVGRCGFPSFSPDGQELAFLSNLTGILQVWRMPSAGGFPEAVTAFDEQVFRALWSPNSEWIAVLTAPGGGMNTQVEVVRADGSERRRLSPGGQTSNWLHLWAKDGSGIFFASNMEDSASMDSYFANVETGDIEKLSRNRGTGWVQDVTEDGSRLLVVRAAYRGDNNLFLIDRERGSDQLLTEHDPPARFSNAHFSADGSCVYSISNRDHDLACLCRLNLEDGSDWTVVRGRDDAELTDFALCGATGLAALVWNVAGRHELELKDLEVDKAPVAVALPGEIVGHLRFSPDGASLAMIVTGARAPIDVWMLDLSSLTMRQLTRSPHVGVNLSQLADAELIRYSAHDGLPLTGWLYRPRDLDPPYATVLSFHGGPEGQEQPRFSYEYQALLLQGIAVFAPNVRGSAGFGKRFVNLDNGALRFDAIRDIASSAQHVVAAGIAQSGRLGIMGGSYGGYMTMAGLTEYPELFAAGVNLYGIVNFRTFFEHTEPWMASVSKVEYGDPETEGAMLDALSPIHKLDRVVAPTLVLHGANDTNVPVVEAEQVVEELRGRDVTVKYILFPDEGHGFNLEKNRIEAATAIVDWFVEHLLD